MIEPKTTDTQPSSRLPEVLPILPLFDTVLFPKMVLPLVVMQKDSIRLVDEAMKKDRTIGLVVSKAPAERSEFPHDDLYRFGTSALILKMAKTEDNKAQLLVQGLARFKVTEFIEGQPYPMGKVAKVTERVSTIRRIVSLERR